MLGKTVRVKVTSPYGYINKRYGFQYKLNFGIIETANKEKNSPSFAYIMGIEHPVKNFDGRVIAAIRRPVGKGTTWVVAPKSTRFINHDINQAISFAEGKRTYNLECLYETSCGAVVFRNSTEGKRFLLIRNKRSSHWGFSKGHVEQGETKTETAIREVFEETGLHTNIIDGFEEYSEYSIQGRIEKHLTLFLAYTDDENYSMQESEIAEIGWFDVDSALETLNYDNDKRILLKADEFIRRNQL